MKRRLPTSLAGAGVAVSLGLTALGGSATFNFDTDPSNDPNFVIGSNVSWTDPVTFEQIDFYEDRNFDGRGEGGNPATGGYLAITRAANSQYSQILFPDFDNGLIVRAFTFDCDLRLGNATGNDGRPADGFSINYARSDDPAVVFLQNNPGTSDTGNYSIPGAPKVVRGPACRSVSTRGPETPGRAARRTSKASSFASTMSPWSAMACPPGTGPVTMSPAFRPGLTTRQRGRLQTQ
ncbi:MAG: hypothetical protein M5U12_37775 [Verrucomicrobia bacterium]|nr:hypothetical protein [Verrucomicrobiota bacterium]